MRTTNRGVCPEQVWIVQGIHRKGRWIWILHDSATFLFVGHCCLAAHWKVLWRREFLWWQMHDAQGRRAWFQLFTDGLAKWMPFHTILSIGHFNLWRIPSQGNERVSHDVNWTRVLLKRKRWQGCLGCLWHAWSCLLHCNVPCKP